MNTRLSWIVLAAVCMVGPLRGEVAVLPTLPDVREVLQGHEAQAAAIQQRAYAELEALKAKTIQQLQAVQDKYTRAAQLDEALAVREQIRKLQRDGTHVVVGLGVRLPLVSGAAANPYQWRDRVGQSYHCEVTGSTSGSVWGSDVYTDDSDLATAAVHAGVLSKGQKGRVKVVILGPNTGFQGMQRHGVTSSSWSSWDGSFRVEPPTGARVAHCRPDPGTLVSVAASNGAALCFQVTGSTEGYVWGSDVYTTDSQLAAAAVHAGVLQPGETGHIIVTLLPGQSSYQSSSRNGVVTHSWSSFPRSFRVSGKHTAGVIELSR